MPEIDRHYPVRSTSRVTAEVEADIPLSADDEDSLTRRILHVTLVDNVHSATARVKASIMHQRRANKNQPWQPVQSFNLVRLPAGQEARLSLSTDETERLYNALVDQYALTHEGIPHQNATLTVVDESKVYIARGREREVLIHLLEDGETGFWELLEELRPNALETVAKAQLHAGRERACAEFERQLESKKWSEADWEAFFRQNTWIFGYGLSFRFLSEVQQQPHYGGGAVTGRGGQRGDFLMASQAAVKFTVLVDIKKPQSHLLFPRPYRNRAYVPGMELSGGIAQLQSNCRTWATEGSLSQANRDLEEQGIFTYEPKGILVIGTTEQLDHRDKQAAFELYRRQLANPEVLTFDELFERARFVVEMGVQPEAVEQDASEPDLAELIEELPF